MSKYLNKILLAMPLALAVGKGYAGGFGLDATRVILTQQQSDSQFQVRNSTKETTYLVATRLSRDENKSVNVPNFLVSPSLFRLDPGGVNAVRVRLLSAAGLPVDRESVFYIMSTGIPSSRAPLRDIPQSGIGAGVTVGVGIKIKLFYRPTGVGSRDKASYQQTTFARVPGGVQLNNPTPFYLNLKSLVIDGKPVKFSSTQPAMVAPLSHQLYGTGSTMKKNVVMTVINDYGGDESYPSTIQ